MKYGDFDSLNREYVVKRPDTPGIWANYLGSPEYGAIISSNAGGYSFVKSGAKGRILRYRFNDFDHPGRYLYLRDDNDGDFWSASWLPVKKDQSLANYVTKHGTGYTKIEADYRGIKSEALYYVPHNKTYEVWNLKLTNTSDKEKNLSVFGYAEFTNDSNYEQDQVNLQYTLFITRTYFKNRFIIQTINENCKNAVNGNSGESRFFGLSKQPVNSFNGDKEAFLGLYDGYEGPSAVRKGECDNTLNYNSNACGALSTKITLAPGETKELTFTLGQKEEAEAASIVAKYDDANIVEEEVNEIKKFWHDKLDNLKVDTPSKEFNDMINTWTSYQCFITFTWSRAASLIYCGQRNGFGYRDTVQDIQGVIHLDPKEAKNRIEFMLSAQVNHGGALPLVKYSHNPGHEDSPEDDSYVKETGHPSYRADDTLWLFPTIYKYISETKDLAFLDKVIPYSNSGEATVYEHLLKAIDFTLNNLGLLDLPAGLHADWNDCLRLGKKGVSVFVALQLYYAYTILSKFAEIKKDDKNVKYIASLQDKLRKTIEDECFEGDRFIRGITENGEKVGSKENKEASLWLNPQSWAVISGFADKKTSEKILDLVYSDLNTPFGAKVMTPSFKDYPFDGALALLFNPGTKENGGIFLQTQGWIILAEALLGRGNKAFQYYKESSPAYQNDIADKRHLEPYVYGQFTESNDSPFEGRSHVHWLTGTATTCMVGMTEGILGLRPNLKGICIEPAIPSEWKEFTMVKQYLGKTLNIKVLNPNGKEGGFTSLTVNGESLPSSFIDDKLLKSENEIILTL